MTTRPAEAPRRPTKASKGAEALILAMIFEDAFWDYLVATWEGKAGGTLSPIPAVAQ